MERQMERWMAFQPCLGCSFDFATGGGERACSWGECAYVPEALNVFCDQCRFDFFTMEGNPPCADPANCEHGAEPRSHVENVHAWMSARV